MHQGFKAIAQSLMTFRSNRELYLLCAQEFLGVYIANTTMETREACLSAGFDALKPCD